MAPPTAAAGSPSVSLQSISVSVDGVPSRARAPSVVTGRLVKQVSQLFSGGTVKDVEMGAIVTKTVAAVWADATVQMIDKESRAVKVLRELLEAAGSNGYSERVLTTLIKTEVAKNQTTGAAKPAATPAPKEPSCCDKFDCTLM